MSAVTPEASRREQRLRDLVPGDTSSEVM